MLVIVYNGYVVDFGGSPGGKFALDASVPAKIVIMRGMRVGG